MINPFRDFMTMALCTRTPVLCLALLAGLVPASRAQSLTWDAGSLGANTTSTVVPASGNWDTSTLNWNNGSADVIWSQTSGTGPTTGATFAGVDGTWNITNTVQIAVTNILFSNSGYTLSGSGLYVGGWGMNVADTKTAAVNCNIVGFTSGANSGDTTGPMFRAGNGSTLYFGGSIQNSVIGIFCGPGNIVITNSGTITTANSLEIHANVNYNSPGGTWTPSGNLDIGRGGFGPNSYYGSTSIQTDPGTLTITAGTINDNVSKFILTRGGGHGTLILNGGVINDWTANNGNSGSGNSIIAIPNNDNSAANHGTFIINGGTLNMGGPGSVTLGQNQLQMMSGGSNPGETGYFTQTGGTANIWGGIQIGGSSTYSGGTVAITNSGGSLYLGSAGIYLGAGSPGTKYIQLSGGTVGALASWSSVLPMDLDTANGNITFQCADASATAHNITLSGALTGPGGLTKTGTGTLTLSGTNSYIGSTTVNSGTLAVTTTSTGAGAYTVANGASLNVQLPSAGAGLNMSSLTLNGNSTLSLNPNYIGNPTVPMINISGVLTPTATVTIILNGTALTSGQFSLLEYGSLGGAGFGAFALTMNSLPAGLSASLINNTANHSIDLNIENSSVASLVWDGTVNGNWDIGGTANWKTNSYYTQSNGIGPAVIFNDTASEPNTAIVLNTTVTPASIVVSNSVLNYSINGFGGIAGTNGLLKEGAGTLTLGTVNAITGGITVNGGMLVLPTGNQAATTYSIAGGTLKVSVTSAGTSLAMSSLAMGNGSPQLAFDLENLSGTSVAAISDSGNLTMNGNVIVNITNLNLLSTAVAILLQYNGRSGSGNFVAGNVPSGVTILDDTVNQQVLAYKPGPRVIIPILNTNEVVVAVTTPQEYGARGDGITDDSAAFQNAMNAVYNSGGFGGGVVYVPPGNYAFYTNLNIPTGVTLHGDWQDWTKGTNGLVGTTFKIYFGAGQTNGTPFIFLNRSTALRDVNIWYPNQNAASIVGYPFSIGVDCDCVVQNVALVNSYQGIQVTAPAGANGKHIFSTVVGTPLFMGISVDNIYDISHTEDIRFSPNVWPASGLTNAPVAGGAYAAWMRANGEGMRLLRVDGEASVDTFISGYKVGIEANSSTNGSPGAQFYNGCVSNCATALLAQTMQEQSGLEFTRFALDGDIAVSHTATNVSDLVDATVGFDNCQIIGRSGPAVSSVGTYFASWMSFQNCTISNALELSGPGVFNAVNCTLLGATQAILNAGITRAAFTGCFFSPTQKIVNANGANSLIIDGRRSISNALPIVNWTNVVNDYLTRKPAQAVLYIATAYGATGNGVTDDTAAIQSALTAAGTNGGGIVYLPGGMYHLTNTLDVPGGVELRGPYEMRHSMQPGSDGVAKGAVLQPYGGQEATNGPVAIALEANSGAVGLSISYETQNTNCIPFPATIQGRGNNVYAIGLCCPNPYIYVDLDSYTCTNHLIYMVDGWTINSGIHVGNGSSGSIVDCHYNTTYWWNNLDSQSVDISSWRPVIESYAENNRNTYVLGSCIELMVKDFSITGNTFMDCVGESGGGPNVTGIGTMCDESVRGFIFDAAAPCRINIVNPGWLAVFSVYGLSNSTVAVQSTTNFQGTARFFNSPVFGGPWWDYIVGGGDVGFELVHMLDHSQLGSRVDGGVLHLVNSGAYITHFTNNLFPAYNIAYGTNAGIIGNVNEYIGCYSYNGCSYTSLSTNNPVLAWVDYNLASPLIPIGLYVVQPPSLTIKNDGSGAETLAWPGNSGAFNLYSANSLVPPIAWTTVTNMSSFLNDQWIVSLPAGNFGQQFYRLLQ